MHLRLKSILSLLVMSCLLGNCAAAALIPLTGSPAHRIDVSFTQPFFNQEALTPFPLWFFGRRSATGDPSGAQVQMVRGIAPETPWGKLYQRGMNRPRWAAPWRWVEVWFAATLWAPWAEPWYFFGMALSFEAGLERFMQAHENAFHKGEKTARPITDEERTELRQNAEKWFAALRSAMNYPPGSQWRLEAIQLTRRLTFPLHRRHNVDAKPGAVLGIAPTVPGTVRKYFRQNATLGRSA